ncbi:MAG: DUF4398 and OmpA-like domain-containing protein [Bryobacterales bacterium]|nr:DUF4398 and OmpA-like domain-containing protein [Bryobacterales bacterium]
MQRLPEATAFGPQYLTYVLWGITPEGRARNLGELIARGGKAKLKATVPLQDFGLIVTAEPYFAVTVPSFAVVAENVITTATMGRISALEVQFELFQQGHYEQVSVNLGDARVPAELKQARLAVEVARRSGAESYAGDSFAKARQSLDQAETYLKRKGNNRKPAIMVAREAAQGAEDARVVAVKRIQEERLAQERQAAADREAAAKRAAAEQAQRAEEATRQQRQAETERAKAEQARQLALAETRTAEAQREAALAARREAESQREAAVAAQREAEKNREAALKARREAEEAERAAAIAKAAAEKERAAALAAAQDAQQQREQAESQRAAALVAAQQAQAQREAAEKERARLAEERNQAIAEKRALRNRLLEQFNSVLETKDTDRGLVLNMGDVLFDTGKFTLRPAARERLSRVAGIFSAYPGLNLEIEGHTDSTGSDELNQRLSEQRAGEVTRYLADQKIASGRMQTRGFGKTRPVSGNDSAEGRQRNRRVEIVVSGEVIGVNLQDAVKD